MIFLSEFIILLEFGFKMNFPSNWNCAGTLLVKWVPDYFLHVCVSMSQEDDVRFRVPFSKMQLSVHKFNIIWCRIHNYYIIYQAKYIPRFIQMSHTLLCISYDTFCVITIYLPMIKCSWLFTRGQYWPSGIVVACVCPSVRPSTSLSAR